MTDSWRHLILSLRKARQLSQAELAEVLGTDQACVSRWERGLTKPQSRSQKKISALAGELERADPDETTSNVAQSIVDSLAGHATAIFDRNEICIAASQNIAHKPGRALAETTSPHERVYLDDWRRFLAEVDFWNTPRATFIYIHQSRPLKGKPPCVIPTLLTSVVINGEIYCMAHFRTPGIDYVEKPDR